MSIFPRKRISPALLPAILLGTIVGTTAQAQHNTLVIIADDVGVDGINAYKEGATPPRTQNIDALAKAGVLFRNAYANPICSPTRATLHTGRYCLRTGVGAVVSNGNGNPLPLAENALPQLLESGGIATALIGKWHLGDNRNGGDSGPNLTGWGNFAGHMWNFKSPQTYYSWRKVINGNAATQKVYATTDNVNDAITWIQSRTKSWTCCICFNAAHGPFHAPPSSLHTYNLTGKMPTSHPALFFKSMVQAMDTKIGRLFSALGPTIMAGTNVIFMGDNGTPQSASQAPFARNHAKRTLYEGGINVPLIIKGPAVVSGGREEKALVNSVDVFNTVLELSGIDPHQAIPPSVPLDGVSMVPYLKNTNQPPLRSYAYAERFGGSLSSRSNDGVAIRNNTYKLIRWTSPKREAFFNLANNPFEKSNLLAGQLSAREQSFYNGMLTELGRLRADYFPSGPGCPGKSGTPSLDLVNRDLPHLGQTFSTRLNGLAANATNVLGILGSSNTRFGQFTLPFDLAPLNMPNCKLQVSVELAFPLPITGGSGTWSLQIPDDANLLGQIFHQQAFVLEPGANAANIITSNGGSGTIGG